MRKLRVLIVDDDPMNRELVQVVLAGLGHEFVVARNGAEAVASAHASRFDLVIMDILMPVMNGLEATRLIRLDPMNQDVPILILSAKTSGSNRETSLAVGADHYVHKPVTRRQLIEAIAKTLERRGVTV